MGAILRHFGVRYGYYNPRDYRQAIMADEVVDTFADVMGALAGVLFAGPDEQAAMAEKYVGAARLFHGVIGKNMNAHKGSYAAGNTVTIADFVMASYVGNYLTNPAFPISA